MSLVSNYISENLVFFKIAAYALVAAALFGAGVKVEAWKADARYSALQASDAAQRADGEEAVRKNLQAQLDTLKATQANNSTVIGKLQDENAKLTADRAANLVLAHRLLDGPKPAAENSPVPETDHRQAAAPASGAGQDGPLAQLLVDVREECGRNADRLDALSAEIAPQL